MMNETMIQRCNLFLETLGVPLTRFCEKVSISTSTAYKWRKGLLTLSEGTLKRIDGLLTKYGF